MVVLHPSNVLATLLSLYVTIASGGNSLDFGNLTTVHNKWVQQHQFNSWNMCAGGASSNVIDYIEIMTLEMHLILVI